MADSQWLVASRISKKGATESRLFRCINSSGISRTCGLTPATLCAVPTGLTFFGQRTQGLRPGLISSAPSGLDLAQFLEEHNISGALDRETETDATTRSNPGTAKCSRRVSHLLILQ